MDGAHYVFGDLPPQQLLLLAITVPTFLQEKGWRWTYSISMSFAMLINKRMALYLPSFYALFIELFVGANLLFTVPRLSKLTDFCLVRLFTGDGALTNHFIALLYD